MLYKYIALLNKCCKNLVKLLTREGERSLTTVKISPTFHDTEQRSMTSGLKT